MLYICHKNKHYIINPSFITSSPKHHKRKEKSTPYQNWKSPASSVHKISQINTCIPLTNIPPLFPPEYPLLTQSDDIRVQQHSYYLLPENNGRPEQPLLFSS